jgi:hypothetical protein
MHKKQRRYINKPTISRGYLITISSKKWGFLSTASAAKEFAMAVRTRETPSGCGKSWEENGNFLGLFTAPTKKQNIDYH